MTYKSDARVKRLKKMHVKEENRLLT